MKYYIAALLLIVLVVLIYYYYFYNRHINATWGPWSDGMAGSTQCSETDCMNWSKSLGHQGWSYADCGSHCWSYPAVGKPVPTAGWTAGLSL